MANSNQLFLLSDHIKLSLLERQRAISLNLEPGSQDVYISRSLDSFREGLEEISKERNHLEGLGESDNANSLEQVEKNLQAQYDDLTSQFHGFPSSKSFIPSSYDNESFHPENFIRTSDRPVLDPSSSFLKRSLQSQTGIASQSPKSVRFSDVANVHSLDVEEAANRAALFPYRDDPGSDIPDHSQFDNQQIHEYHSQVIAEQDEQLDRLGESIRRQGELSIQIGNELDDHVQLLEEVDGRVERHQSRLDKARKQLGMVARKAKDNKQMTIIVVLIILLVLLIAILK